MKIKRLGDLLGLTPKSSEGVPNHNPGANAPTEGESPEMEILKPDNPPDIDLSAETRSPSVEVLQPDNPAVDAEPEVPPTTNDGIISLTEPDDPSPATQDQPVEESSGSITYTDKQLQAGQGFLDGFLQRCEGAYGVIVSSIDGNPVVHQTSQELPVERLANMTSSLLALGETIARESLQKLCRFVILENQDGRVVCLRINRVLMLTCITGKESNLGMVLNIGQKTSEGLKEVF